MTATDNPDLPAPPLRPKAKARSFATMRTIMALILREMSTSYGRNPGGYIWAFLEPAAGIAIMATLFSLGFRHPPIGSNFALFFASGMVPFFMWQGLVMKIGASLAFSKQLLGYPAVTYLDALIARFLLNAITLLLVNYIILVFIIIAWDVPVSLRFGRIALGYAELLSFAIGVGLLNSFLTGVLPVWGQIFSIITRPLFLVSGTIFIYEQIPSPYNQYLLWNPITHGIATIRSGFYARYDAAYADPVFVFSVSGVLGIAGLLFLHRFHKYILFR
ncbi:ABC transporter permease [Phaeobacter marinintestinus]|uniref:ABC transporter permease n=1 Tax=Falsiphaeobacter marinintestinus TaxID=1492905 RepID=UPI001FE44D3F|nr:ABC transporter permease [Phaeobacter marinintestinus]